MRRFVAFLGLLFAVTSQSAQASYQIGQFSNDGTTSFAWTNTGNVSAGLSGSSAGYFTYSNAGSLQPALPPELLGPQAAHMTITASTATSGYTYNGQLIQPLSGTITISITRDSPLPGHAGTNLLTATESIGNAVLTGSGSSGAVFASQPNDNVAFTSDFINTSLLTNPALAVSLVAITPQLSFNTAGGNAFLNDFSAAGLANFSANAVPEPTSLCMLGIGCLVFLARRKVSTDSN